MNRQRVKSLMGLKMVSTGMKTLYEQPEVSLGLVKLVINIVAKANIVDEAPMSCCSEFGYEAELENVAHA